MQIQCASNLRQWSAAALMYAQQENGWLPRRGQGVQVTTHSVAHLMDGKMMGTFVAHYANAGADSVLRGRIEGTKKP